MAQNVGCPICGTLPGGVHSKACWQQHIAAVVGRRSAQDELPMELTESALREIIREELHRFFNDNSDSN